MSDDKKINWNQSVAGVLIEDNRVLLARHTYGSGKGKLIVPGGYVDFEETPQAALKREFFEEVGIEVEPEDIIGIRFNYHDWYVVFRVKYISGIPRADHMENSEVLWVDVEDALSRVDVPELTKKLIVSAISTKESLKRIDYISSSRNGLYSYYGLD